MEKKLFTSESVAEGHPDKVADQIADAILDAALAQDRKAHVACEVFTTKEFVLIGGELTTTAKLDYEGIARKVLRDIGYTSPELGIGADSCKVQVVVNTQSPDIAMGVDKEDPLQQGAGDQGIMFGYATDETEGYMPLPISIAHKLVRTASEMRKSGRFPHARPDMKSQVTMDYSIPGKPQIHTILMSVQHDPDIDKEAFRKFIHDQIMVPVAASFGFNTDFDYLVNPTGSFVIGGPLGDTGLTGRKLIVDTYGGAARHGGGAFSGKDPSKVDRSASYYARYMAKNIVASGAAKRAEIQLSYAIGVAEPLSIGIETFCTETVPVEDILRACREVFDARPGAIIAKFKLTQPEFSYADTCIYGAFGRPDLHLPWEKLDMVAELKAKLGL